MKNTNYKEQYGKVINEKTKISEQIKVLEQNEIIKKYLDLKNQEEILGDEEARLKEILSGDEDGLKEIIGNEKDGLEEILTDEETKLYVQRLIEKNIIAPGELKLAVAIIKKIKAAHPDIDEETTIRYIQKALYDMKNQEVNYDRRKGRAKRLALEPEFFERW